MYYHLMFFMHLIVCEKVRKQSYYPVFQLFEFDRLELIRMRMWWWESTSTGTILIALCLCLHIRSQSAIFLITSFFPSLSAYSLLLLFLSFSSPTLPSPTSPPFFRLLLTSSFSCISAPFTCSFSPRNSTHLFSIPIPHQTWFCQCVYDFLILVSYFMSTFTLFHFEYVTHQATSRIRNEAWRFKYW